MPTSWPNAAPNLITCARRLEPLEADAQILRQRYGVQVQPVAMDLASPDRPVILSAFGGA